MKKIAIILLVVGLCATFVVGQTKRTAKTKKLSKISPSVARTKPGLPSILPAPIDPRSAEKNASKPLAESTLIELPKFEAEILVELNRLRTNPADYAVYLESYLKTFDGQYFRNSEGGLLTSFEGKTPVTEVIEILKQTKSLPEFKVADGMVKAASDHARDLVKNNKTGHQGTNGSFPDERVGLYGSAPAGTNENISYGPRTARDVVLTMLVDDGNTSRNHRKNLLNPNLKIVGLATGQIKEAGMACVLVLATSFSESSK